MCIRDRAISYRRSIVTKSLFQAIFEIMGIKHIGVMTLTFQGHVTSSVTWLWPLYSQGAISYRHSIVTKSLSPAVSEIMGTKHIGVITLTFQGHVTSSVTWPFDFSGPISYRHSIVTKSLSPAVSEIMGTKQSFSRYWPLRALGSRRHHRSRDRLIPRWPFPIGAPLSPSLYFKLFSR